MNLRPMIALLLVFGATPLLVAGAPPPQTVEMGIEANTEGVSLPSSMPGPLVFSGCASCNRSPLRVTAATALMLGAKTLTLSELTRVVHSGSHFMMIYYKPGSPDITRIVVSAD